MPRPTRFDYPGAFHHVMHRGARRAPIFARPDDCVLLLDTIEDAVARFNTEVHAYSLMPNHYHLLVRSIHGDLSRFMQFVDGQYTMRLNRRHRWDGPVFRGRFHNQLVRNPRHLRFLVPYLHLNPIRAHLAREPEEECWTSHRAYLGLEPKPPWLATTYFLRLLGGRDGLRELITGVHQGRIAWPADLNLDSGYFIDEDPGTAPAPAPRAPAGARPGVRSTARPTASEALARVEAITQTSATQLRQQQYGPRANPARRFAVWALVQNAALTHKEAGAHLGMSTTAVGKVLSRIQQRERAEPLDEWIRAWEASRDVSSGGV